ncbi:MAG TPA: 6,7-dimethyl-8-ribityllumazine synthase [Verrucomicrobiae bacterium]|nr:6,7-dimethyl-8-ribityllumazine synthase [Verrucomicrobiae bacterium]
MLQSIKSKGRRADGARFAIVASQYNGRYVNAMLRAAAAELKRAGAAGVRIIRVPGAYEIPLIAARLARGGEGEQPPDAIICLGVILRGQTVHAAHIGEAVSQALMRIQIDCGVPIIHEVLLLENEEQARARCLDRRHNRGMEAARTAVEMALVMRELG